MSLIMWAPLLLAGAFGVVAPLIARRLPPALGTWLLSVGGLMAAAGALAVLGFLAFTLAGRAPLLAAHGHWSPTVLRHADPVIVPVEVAASLALAAVTARVAAAIVRRSRALRDAYRLAAALPAHGAELAVIADPIPCAYAVPGRPGRIVASIGLLRGLHAEERRAVLAHERSHLRHHHHAHYTAAQLAAANPLLRALPAAVTLATERWADEDAARTAARDTVAQALIHAASTPRQNTATPAVVLAAAAEQITARVHAMRAPAPQPSAWRIAALLAVLLLTTASTLLAAHDTERLFEFAKHAYLAAHH